MGSPPYTIAGVFPVAVGESERWATRPFVPGQKGYEIIPQSKPILPFRYSPFRNSLQKFFGRDVVLPGDSLAADAVVIPIEMAAVARLTPTNGSGARRSRVREFLNGWPESNTNGCGAGSSERAPPPL